MGRFNMKIRFLKALASPTFDFQEGEVAEVEQAFGHQLIGAGTAVVFEDASSEGKMEDASRSPSEDASLLRRRKRKRSI